MLAYAAAQTAAPGYLVLYRVGEFYEVLGQDAATVSRALGLQLTRRRRRTPMMSQCAGFPPAHRYRLLPGCWGAGTRSPSRSSPRKTEASDC